MIVKVSLSFAAPDSALVDLLKTAGVDHKIHEFPEHSEITEFLVEINLQKFHGGTHALDGDHEFTLGIMNRILVLKSLIPDMPRYAPNIDFLIRNAERYSSIHLHRDLIRMITDLDANMSIIADNQPAEIEHIN